MSDMNPYAPPSEEQASPKKKKKKRAREEGPTGVWRDGEHMVVDQMGAELPNRCVVCNAPADGYRLRKTFMWHPQWIYMLIFIGLLFYIIGAALTRKRGTASLGLCDQHRERRTNGINMAWIGFTVAFVLMIACIMADQTVLVPLVVLLMIAAPIAGGFMARIVTVHKIDDQYMWFKPGRPFLDSLPEWDDRG